MNPIEQSIDELLKFDPIAQAERFTGRRIGNSLKDPTASLGFVLNYQSGQQKEGLLAMQDDTRLGLSWKDAKRIFQSEGFEIVLSEEFPDLENKLKEEFVIGWHPDGILLVAESYQKDSQYECVNTAKIYYSIKGNRHEIYKKISSGGFHVFNEEGNESIWQGNHDVREAFRHKLNELRSVGTFIPEWPERPWLWLLTYMDTKVEGYDYKAINQVRIAKLPKHIQKAIKGKMP